MPAFMKTEKSPGQSESRYQETQEQRGMKFLSDENPGEQHQSCLNSSNAFRHLFYFSLKATVRLMKNCTSATITMETSFVSSSSKPK